MRKRFEFSLEKLLGHKITLENVARREWIEARAKADAAQKELQGMYDVIDDNRKRSFELELAGSMPGVALGQIDEFIKGQKIRIERFRVVVRELLGEVERKHEALVEAARERKTLEKLKENQLAEYKLKMKKQELKRVDELVVTRFKNDSTENG